MRVLHVIDSLAAGGGAEESLVGMLPRLRSLGIDGQVLCLYAREGHQQALRDKGFHVDVLGGKSRLAQAQKIRRVIKETNPDLVHASLIDACLATRLAMVGLSTPQLNSLVNTTYDPVRVSGLMIPRWKMLVLRLVDRWTSRWVNPGFHALTDAVKQEAVEVLGIPSHKVWVIPRGRDPQQMGSPSLDRRNRVRAALGIDQDRIVVLNVGRQEPQKAKTLLVEAFSQVARSRPQLDLLIAGKKGKDSENLLSTIKRSPVSDRIQLLGHRSDIADLLAASDLFVFPSHYEGLGGALVEALCMGCPTIGSDAPAIAEVLGYGEYGLIVPRRNVPALANAMRTLADSKEERAAWSRKARERFQENFELSSVIDRMAELYRKLAKIH